MPTRTAQALLHTGPFGLKSAASRENSFYEVAASMQLSNGIYAMSLVRRVDVIDYELFEMGMLVTPDHLTIDASVDRRVDSGDSSVLQMMWRQKILADDGEFPMF